MSFKPFKRSFTVITTNFALEPVLDSYLQMYPNGDFTAYQIVFKSENERAEGETTYILIFDLAPAGKKEVSFTEYLQSHCTVNRLAASASPLNSIFPTLQGIRHAHYFGLPPTK